MLDAGPVTLFLYEYTIYNRKLQWYPKSVEQYVLEYYPATPIVLLF
jgi:hypothetical protein